MIVTQIITEILKYWMHEKFGEQWIFCAGGFVFAFWSLDWAWIEWRQNKVAVCLLLALLGCAALSGALFLSASAPSAATYALVAVAIYLPVWMAMHRKQRNRRSSSI